jgi:phenylpropionate dioxygenase-like ring-hydroxylating dioxygenase large terminal subunit
MMSEEQNRLITRIEGDAPAGRLLSSYWQPTALLDELDEVPGRPLKALRIMGHDLVLFRDETGKLGLIDRDCPHRNADLAFGRLEDGGLRCPFHGWLFDVDGKCLDTPAEPPGSRLCENIRQRTYPIEVRSGIVFAYFGAGTPPALPDFDCFIAPDTHTFAFKGLVECNWLQALEVGMDPAHASFLHRYEEDADPNDAYGRPFRGTSADSNLPITKVLREYPRPQIDVDTTDYGLRITTLRKIDETLTHVRVTNIAFPNAFIIPLSETMTISQWHVPVDDTNNYWFAIFTSFAGPVDKAEMRAQRLAQYDLPLYRSRRNRENNYGYNADEQKCSTYTGMGFDVNAHDQWAIESQGRIQDRRREHLGQSDKAISVYRRILRQQIEAVQAGERPMMALNPGEARKLRGPAAIDGLARNVDSTSYWTRIDAQRRAEAPWPAHPPQAAE